MRLSGGERMRVAGSTYFDVWGYTHLIGGER